MRIAAIAIIALCMAATAAAEEVLYCTDTDVNGFVWDEQGNAKRFVFKPERFTVKVISETKRIIITEGRRHNFVCTKINKEIRGGNLHCYADFWGHTDMKKVEADAVAQGMSAEERKGLSNLFPSSPSVDQAIIFRGNNYTRAYMQGGPAGFASIIGALPDSSISIAYGTCTKF